VADPGRGVADVLLPRQARLRQQQEHAVGGVFVVKPGVVLERVFVLVLPEAVGQVVTEDLVIDLSGPGEVGVVHGFRQGGEEFLDRGPVGGAGLGRKIVEAVVVAMVTGPGGVEGVPAEVVVKPGSEDVGETGVLRGVRGRGHVDDRGDGGGQHEQRE
jgi:hypothetical protein